MHPRPAVPFGIHVRRFAFEGRDDALLATPWAVRRKLDLSAVRLPVDSWRALPWHERLALCELPAETDDEISAFRTVLEGFARRTGVPTLALPPVIAPPWRDVVIPPVLARRLMTIRAPVQTAVWTGLDDLERFALCKLAEKRDVSRLLAALAEFGMIGPAPREQAWAEL